ncbi:REP-associated tyrosine transposase [Dyella mobilis]|uniref:Transposase n=1 Tax=Dyella mobilis TaxID=1849582 RepID=A0ABS2K9R9_9GAMM|nr:transposase [Dyella mobilis]MBM7127938.1 transposase [Dyella mobilis]GLR00145.1 transposase [Dyella mobilis]
MRYRRSNTSGATYFFTVNLADRTNSLLTYRIGALREAVRTVKHHHPFHIIAWVVLPEHLHAVWTMPDHDSDYSTRWRLIKRHFSTSIEHVETTTPSRRRKNERCIWQRRFWEHQIRDEKDLQNHVDYVHINPVKHGYCRLASEWPYSSIHRAIRQGIVTPDWASEPDLVTPSGESRPQPRRLG